jgi:hypothetical protein
MTNTDAIRFAMRAFVEEYGGDRFKVTKERRALWAELLKDITGEVVLAATKQILADPSPFPPTVGQVRAKCVDITTGTIGGETAAMAWDVVLAYIAGTSCDTSHMSEKCLRALKSVGGTWQVMHSDKPGVVRAQFIKSYDSYKTSEREEVQTLPDVKALAGENRLKQLVGNIGQEG